MLTDRGDAMAVTPLSAARIEPEVFAAAREHAPAELHNAPASSVLRYAVALLAGSVDPLSFAAPRAAVRKPRPVEPYTPGCTLRRGRAAA